MLSWLRNHLAERTRREQERQRYIELHDLCDGGICDWWSHTLCQRHEDLLRTRSEVEHEWRDA